MLGCFVVVVVVLFVCLFLFCFFENSLFRLTFLFLFLNALLFLVSAKANRKTLQTIKTLSGVTGPEMYKPVSHPETFRQFDYALNQNVNLYQTLC